MRSTLLSTRSWRCLPERCVYPLLFERSMPGRRGGGSSRAGCPCTGRHFAGIPCGFRAAAPAGACGSGCRAPLYEPFPAAISAWTNGFYPLGSCTMKYNPKINEEVAPLFNDLHPLADQDCAAGAIRMMHALEQALCEIADLINHAAACGGRARRADGPHAHKSVSRHAGGLCAQRHYRAGCSAWHQPGLCRDGGLQNAGDQERAGWRD